MVYDTYNELVIGVYKPIYNWGDYEHVGVS